MHSTSESLLLQLRGSKNEQAWQTFVELYTPLLFYWARRTGLKTNDAADLVQDVLTLVFQKLPSFEYDKSRSFRSWLRTVTINRYRETLRKKSIGAKPATASVLAQHMDPSAAESTWDLNYQHSLLHEAMELLSDEFEPITWKALHSYVFEAKPASDAAAENGLSVWTVYAAKSRFMKRLRETVEGLL